MTILMNELTLLVAVMKYRLQPTTNTCNVRKCQTSGHLPKVDHNTNTETVFSETVGVVCREFDRLSQHQWRLRQTTKHAPASFRALWSSPPESNSRLAVAGAVGVVGGSKHSDL